MADRLTAAIGTRVDGNTFTETGNEVWRTFSPRASLAYQLDAAGRWTVNASIGRYFKIPPYTTLGVRDTLAQSFLNRDAKYIESLHYVAGIEYLVSPSARISVEGFYKRYSNYPVSTVDSVSLANLGGGFEVLGNEKIESIGLGRTYGLEFLFQQKFTNNIYGILAYTLYKSEFTGFDRDRYLPSFWDSRHLLTFTGGYKFGNNWEASARVRNIGRTPYAPVDEEATLANYPIIVKDYSNLGDKKLGRFTQLDVRIDKKFNFPNWTLDIFLNVDNALASQLPQEPSFGLTRDEETGEIIMPRSLTRITNVSNSAPLPSLGVIIDF